MVNSGIMEMEEFENLISKNAVSVVDFSATWCGPCRMMAPIVEDSSNKHKGEYFYYGIDVDSSPELAEKYAIEFVPTFIVFSKGKLLGKTSGLMDLEEFENFIKQSLEKAE